MQPSILIVGPAWVGDMVMTHTLVRKLHLLYPSCTIDMLGPKWSLPLVARMPGVRRGICADFAHGQVALKERYALGCQLRAHQYDMAFLIPNSFKSALVPCFARIPKRIGWLGEMRWGVLTQAQRLDKAAIPQMAQRIATLADFDAPDLSPPRPELRVTEGDQAVCRAKFNFSNKPILALCPGAAFGPSKQWHLQGWSAVAKTYLSKGWDVALLGSAKDAQFCEQILDHAGEAVFNLAGKTSLQEAVDILSMAKGAVTNDSGMMHIAAALDVPLVAVYGSSDPSFTPPLNPQAMVVREQQPCSPCFKRTCPLIHHNCMAQITPTQVLSALSQAMDMACVS